MSSLSHGAIKTVHGPGVGGEKMCERVACILNKTIICLQLGTNFVGTFPTEYFEMLKNFLQAV